MDDEFTREILKIARSLIAEDEEFEYPEAGGELAQPEVKKAVERFRQLPVEERAKQPLLYWLLGAGTPPYKVSKKDSEYKDPTEIPNQTCDNCEFYYFETSNDVYICSQISGDVKPKAWCNLWDSASNKK